MAKRKKRKPLACPLNVGKKKAPRSLRIKR